VKLRQTKPIQPAREGGTRSGDAGAGQLYKQTQSGVASRVEGPRREQTKPISRDVARGTRGGARVQTKPVRVSPAGGRLCKTKPIRHPRTGKTIAKARDLDDATPHGGNRAKQSQFSPGRPARVARHAWRFVTSRPWSGTKNSRGLSADRRVARPR